MFTHCRRDISLKVKELMRTSVARVAPAVTVGETLARMDGSGVTSAAIGDGLSSYLVTATPEMDVARVAEMMRDRGVDDIMVVEGRSLVGALSLAEAGKAETGLRPGL